MDLSFRKIKMKPLVQTISSPFNVNIYFEPKKYFFERKKFSGGSVSCINVHFFTDSECEKINKLNDSPATCDFLSRISSGEEEGPDTYWKRLATEKGIPPLISHTALIVISNLSIEDFLGEQEIASASAIWKVAKKCRLQDAVKDISPEIIFPVFLFLHEVGHWQQFEKCGWDFLKVLIKYRDSYRINNRIDAIQAEIRANFEARGDLLPSEIKILEDCALQYRKSKQEREADLFALKHLNSSLLLLKSSGLLPS